MKQRSRPRASCSAKARAGPITIKSGRFGPYVEMPNGEDKPKRASLPKGKTPETMDLETAIKLLSLPREVGMHPSENEMVLANIGRYGPYIQMGKTYVNLPNVEDVFEIQMNRAVALFEEKKAGGGKGRFGRAAPAPIKESPESPVTGKPVRVLSGRYGPYVSDGETNANIPRDVKPEEVSNELALQLLAARAEAGGGKKKGRAPKKEAVKKEAAPKKAAAEEGCCAKGCEKSAGQKGGEESRGLDSIILLPREGEKVARSAG